MDQPVVFCGGTRFFRDDLNIYQNEQGVFPALDDDVMHWFEAKKAGKAVLVFQFFNAWWRSFWGRISSKVVIPEVIYERDQDTLYESTSEQNKAWYFWRRRKKQKIRAVLPKSPVYIIKHKIVSLLRLVIRYHNPKHFFSGLIIQLWGLLLDKWSLFSC